jgi:hypothetical protein
MVKIVLGTLTIFGCEKRHQLFLQSLVIKENFNGSGLFYGESYEGRSWQFLVVKVGIFGLGNLSCN